MPDHRIPLIERCPAGCPGDAVASDIVLPEGPLMRCPFCGHLFFPMEPSVYTASMAGFDDPAGTCLAGEPSRRDLKRCRRMLHRVARHAGRPVQQLRFLDVGCSSGSLLMALRHFGVEATGVEPMPRPAATARAAGLDVRTGILTELTLPPASFDIITLMEVIEHLAAPALLLAECRRLLRPGGLMVIRTGNADSWTVRIMRARWDYFCPSIGHISFFTPRSMRLLAQRSGFAMVGIHFHSVSLFRRSDVSPLVYRLGKILAEVLNGPSRWLGRSHEMEVYLRPDV